MVIPEQRLSQVWSQLPGCTRGEWRLGKLEWHRGVERHLFRTHPGLYTRQLTGIFRNPGEFTTDTSILKRFYLSDSKSRYFEARLEALNILNHPNFGSIIRDPDSPNFGGIDGKTGQRVMQIGVRFFF